MSLKNRYGIYDSSLVDSLNKDIELFPEVFPIEKGMKLKLSGVSRLVMLDRYTMKDSRKETLKKGDLVIVTIIEDDRYPTLGIGNIVRIIDDRIEVKLEEEYEGVLGEEQKLSNGNIVRNIDLVTKPLEIYFEQIAKRNAKKLSSVEKKKDQKKWFNKFYEHLSNLNIVPAGRVLYGAGSETDVTYFNCYVMPYPSDSREGIADHRKTVMEIMSRGGGVGTNGSTLRPKSSYVKGVDGSSSGAVSWLNDIAELTHLVEQGGSRRGAQMIMLADWHPDIIQFIISKIQNPNVLRHIIKTTKDEQIKREAENKLKFTPLTESEVQMYEGIIKQHNQQNNSEDQELFSEEIVKKATAKLKDGGTYSVNNPDFLTGANISVAITEDFMKAIEKDETYALRFPDIESYNDEDMEYYNNYWKECGDVRDWDGYHGLSVKTHRTIRARDLWGLINVCATYSAEPGVFFIDNANEKTNAKAYGQSVVATNPCGEQPLAPYSVCNLAAINLAEMVNKETKVVDFEKLAESVKVAVRLQDNVIDATPYFLEENKKQALGERRIGLGVMGLHDLLIYCEKRYGSKEGNWLVDKVFETIATTAYRTSIEIAKEKGSFPYLIGDNKEETEILRNEFVKTGYMKNMPIDIKIGIIKHGIRNSHLLTVAPTGSTGTMVGGSTGLEPYFSFSYFRSGRLGRFMEVKADIVEEYLESHPEADPNALPDWFVAAMELSPEEHVDVQCVIQKWVDSSISKTVNAPKGYSVENVQKIYEDLYKKGAKGGTVYVDGSRSEQVLTLDDEENTWENEFSDELNEVDRVNEVDQINETDDKTEGSSNTESNDEKEKAKEEEVGTELGQVCPTCKEGIIQMIGGCHTCDGCGMALQCEA